MKPTHKTVYTIDIKRNNMCCCSSATAGPAGTSHWRSAVRPPSHCLPRSMTVLAYRYSWLGRSMNF